MITYMFVIIYVYLYTLIWRRVYMTLYTNTYTFWLSKMCIFTCGQTFVCAHSQAKLFTLIANIMFLCQLIKVNIVGIVLILSLMFVS